MDKKTLVLGASLNSIRYSNRVIYELVKKGVDVVAIGIKKGSVSGIEINTNLIETKGVHTVSIYLNKLNQKAYYNYITTLHPKRVLFNPGSENEEFEAILRSHNIFSERACSLVLLALGKY
jgi:predicted CoA-binding protein